MMFYSIQTSAKCALIYMGVKGRNGIHLSVHFVRIFLTPLNLHSNMGQKGHSSRVDRVFHMDISSSQHLQLKILERKVLKGRCYSELTILTDRHPMV